MNTSTPPLTPSIIAIFGITGDLSKRRLLPAIYHLFSQNLLPAGTSIVGISRQPLTVDDILQATELCVLAKDKVCDPEVMERLRAALYTHQLIPTEPQDYVTLRELFNSLDDGQAKPRLLHLSIPPAAYEPIVAGLASAGLNDKNCQLLLEKPFGYNLDSAERLIKLVEQAYSEEQIYRIDHYLAKETALNLLAFRLHNPIFAPLWNGEHIQRVHIRALETLDIEGRTTFYEQTGALRDIIQSHLMQLLCLTMMDVPSDMSSQAIHASKQHFLEQLAPASPAHAVRGQYAGYRDAVENPNSRIETYALLHLQHTAERWQNVDIILETGKALALKTTDVTVEFKTPHERRRNSLTFRLQPNEGIGLDLVVKEPGLDDRMRHAALEFRYDHTFKDEQHIDAYERVLMDALRKDQSLFASDREVMATWQVLQPVLNAWADSDHGMLSYPIGAMLGTESGDSLND